MSDWADEEVLVLMHCWRAAYSADTQLSKQRTEIEPFIDAAIRQLKEGKV